MDNAAINRARILYYGLFSSLFSFSMGAEKYQTIVSAVDILRRNPMDEQSEKALSNMQRRLAQGGYAALQKECDRVFHSPTTVFVPMTASYYHEQRDGGRKRVEMIDYVLKSKFRRNAETYKEHEDHIEFVMRFLQQLIVAELQGDTAARLLAAQVFSNILNEMVDEFADNLFRHEQSFFYKQVVLALRSFIDFERIYLNISRPEKNLNHTSRKTEHDKEKQEARKCIQLDSFGCV